ncbi:unnamed protein product, partial [Staurois parvus]
MIGAQQCHPPVPPTCAQQCTHLCPEVPPTCVQQCHPPVPINAVLPVSATNQCPAVVPVSAQRLCQSVPSGCASQCLAV